MCRFIFIDFNCAFRYFGYLWTDSNLQAWHLRSVKWHSKYMYMNAWHQTLSRAGTRFLLSGFVWPLLWFLLYTLNLVWYISVIKMLAFFGLTHLLIEVKYDLVRLIQHFLDKMNGTGKFKLDVERGRMWAWCLQVFLLKIMCYWHWYGRAQVVNFSKTKLKSHKLISIQLKYLHISVLSL